MPRLLVNNDKEVVATFENDYFGFTQLMPDGTRLASSNHVFRSVPTMAAATAAASKNTPLMVR